jgi:hypothetical protein
MRLRATLGLCLGLMFLTAGCDPFAENRLFREGIGTDLNRPDIADVTRAQDVYLGYICQQAGLSVVRTADGAVRCNAEGPSPRNWALIVQAGMNDIDERCDAYLAWLDDRRRSRSPILSQINALQTSTTAVMRFTGAGANPISVVGEAFGLASSTFTNLNSRLLLEVNHSTVQAVVMNRRNDYRVGIANVTIDNRPAAIHALRSYLNICMPFTIEMDINTTVTAFQFGGPSALANRPPPNSPDTVRGSAAPRPVIKSTDALEKTAAVKTTILNPSGPFESALSLSRGKEFQNTLCVAPTGDFGRTGTPSETRIELKNFNIAYLYPTDTGATGTIATSAQLAYLRRARNAFPSCTEAKLMNGFEVGILSRFGIPKFRTYVKKALDDNALIVAGFTANGAKMDEPLRNAIKALGKKFSAQNPPEELDRAFYAWIESFSER